MFVYMRASKYYAAEHCQLHTKISSRMPPNIQTSGIVYSRIYAFIMDSHMNVNINI
jgi:hypothetical protein